jgi:hypothetical protein
MKDKIIIKGSAIYIYIANMVFIRIVDKILFCRSCGGYTEIYFCTGESLHVNMGVNAVAKLLNFPYFFMCHKCHIINFKLVLRACITGNNIVFRKYIIPGLDVPVKLLKEGGEPKIESARLNFRMDYIPISLHNRGEFDEKLQAYIESL